jgi:hypothetical protein
VIRRKAEVVAAGRGGLLSLDDACNRYMLTVEEFLTGNVRLIDTASPGCGQPVPSDIAYSRAQLPRSSTPNTEPYSFFCD